MTYYQAIMDALIAEALHKERGEADIILPEKVHESVPDSIPISYLGACPKLKSLERRDAAPKIEGMRWQDKPETIFKVNDGNMTEAFVQRALIRAGLASHDSIEVNTRLVRETLQLHGRIDAITHYTPEGEILEIKRSEKFFGKAPTPFMKYSFQALAYGLSEKIRNMYILMMEHAGAHLYKLERNGAGWEVWNVLEETRLKADWNDPNFINPRMIQVMALRHAYHQAMTTEELMGVMPITDPFNALENFENGDAWQCCKVVKGRGKNDAAVAAPKCPFSCHFDENKSRMLTNNNGKLELSNILQTVETSEDDLFAGLE